MNSLNIANRKARRKVYERTAFKMKLRKIVTFVVTAAAAALTLICAAVCSAIEQSWTAPVIVYLLLQAADCAVSLLGLKVLKQTAWERV